jgi:hypothetical protein
MGQPALLADFVGHIRPIPSLPPVAIVARLLEDEAELVPLQLDLSIISQKKKLSSLPLPPFLAMTEVPPAAPGAQATAAASPAGVRGEQASTSVRVGRPLFPSSSPVLPV